jgi:lipopolysaccharide/colanic/teichoic acid biosynthesis glycosyltransferase
VSVHPSDQVTTTDRARRGLNVAAAAVGIVLATPVMLLIALAIRLTSKGPILYRQTRVGVDRRLSSGRRDACRRVGDVGGRPFMIYKFRTMSAEDGSETSQVWACADDPRITPIGRVLRKFRLDELPQLLNVLRGDMNLVGPRPEQPDIFADLRHQVSRYPERQRVLPGITGWAQVRHHYDTSIDDVKRKVEFDLEYISRCSAAEDAKIMLMTVPVMMFKRGAH